MSLVILEDLVLRAQAWEHIADGRWPADRPCPVSCSKEGGQPFCAIAGRTRRPVGSSGRSRGGREERSQPWSGAFLRTNRDTDRALGLRQNTQEYMRVLSLRHGVRTYQATPYRGPPYLIPGPSVWGPQVHPSLV